MANFHLPFQLAASSTRSVQLTTLVRFTICKLCNVKQKHIHNFIFSAQFVLLVSVLVPFFVLFLILAISFAVYR